MIKICTILTFSLLFLTLNSWGKVDPPNYNFSLDSLAQFKPGTSLEELEKSKGKGEVLEKSGERTVLKYYVAHIRYKFPIFVQIYKGQVLDYYARLPSYFLHDVFHQSLINRYGKQNKYFKKESAAVYEWDNKDNSHLVYQGTCTITCFPIFLSMITNSPPSDMENFKPLLDTLKINY